MPNYRYKDLDLDFTDHPVTGDVVKKIDEDAIKRAIRNLILTNYYEVPFKPDVGCGIRNYLFEHIDFHTRLEIKDKIQETLTNFEPRINVVDIQVNENQYDKNAIDVIIKYNEINQPEPYVITITLDSLS